MAYNYGFPATYQPFNPYAQQFAQQMFPAQQMQPQQMQQQPQPAQAPQQGQPQQIQNGGFVSVRSRAEAQGYPVAPGNSVTFKDETAPFVYVKTMGFSSLDRPTFEAFRLVKEDAEPAPAPENVSRETIDLSAYATKKELSDLASVVAHHRDEIEKLTAAAKKPVSRKKEASDDE